MRTTSAPSIMGSSFSTSRTNRISRMVITVVWLLSLIERSASTGHETTSPLINENGLQLESDGELIAVTDVSHENMITPTEKKMKEPAESSTGTTTKKSKKATGDKLVYNKDFSTPRGMSDAVVWLETQLFLLETKIANFTTAYYDSENIDQAQSNINDLTQAFNNIWTTAQQGVKDTNNQEHYQPLVDRLIACRTVASTVRKTVAEQLQMHQALMASTKELLPYAPAKKVKALKPYINQRLRRGSGSSASNIMEMQNLQHSVRDSFRTGLVLSEIGQWALQAAVPMVVFTLGHTALIYFSYSNINRQLDILVPVCCVSAAYCTVVLQPIGQYFKPKHFLFQIICAVCLCGLLAALKMFADVTAWTKRKGSKKKGGKPKPLR